MSGQPSGHVQIPASSNTRKNTAGCRFFCQIFSCHHYPKGERICMPHNTKFDDPKKSCKFPDPRGKSANNYEDLPVNRRCPACDVPPGEKRGPITSTERDQASKTILRKRAAEAAAAKSTHTAGDMEPTAGKPRNNIYDPIGTETPGGAIAGPQPFGLSSFSSPWGQADPILACASALSNEPRPSYTGYGDSTPLRSDATPSLMDTYAPSAAPTLAPEQQQMAPLPSYACDNSNCSNGNRCLECHDGGHCVECRVNKFIKEYNRTH